MDYPLSIILPAKNEAGNLVPVLAQLAARFPTAEIVVVDDGSTDATAPIARAQGARVVSHPYSLGNGAAVKTGARHATGEVLVFLDADGQHDPADISRMLAKLDEGYEMVVGARQVDTHASLGRRLANHGYNRLASWMTGYRIEDLTSGFRAVRARHFRKFLYLLPNGFSYPTTSTMAFFRAGFPVAYVPIRAGRRGGKSHINVLRDGSRFVLIILKIGALFSPMRFFLPLSLLFLLTGVGYYGYTYLTMNRFTNMSAVLLIYSLSLFLIRLLDVVTLARAPRLAVLDTVAGTVAANLPDCRAAWWRIHGKTRLNGQWLKIAADGAGRPAIRTETGALQVARSHYDVAQGAVILFFKGQTESWTWRLT